MLTPLTSLLACAALTAVLAIIFAIEDRRGAVFLPRVRAGADRLVTTIGSWWARILHHVANGSVRLMFHYLVHRTLTLLTRVFSGASHYFEQLKRRNKRIARTVQKERFDSHLSLIAAHKKEQALTKREREVLRERSLEGR